MHTLAIKDVWTSCSSSLGLWPEARPWKTLFPRPLIELLLWHVPYLKGPRYVNILESVLNVGTTYVSTPRRHWLSLTARAADVRRRRRGRGVLTLFRVSSFPQHSPDLLLFSSYVYQYFPHTSGICSALNPSINCLKWSVLLISYRQTIVTGHRTGRKLCRKLRLLLPWCMNFFNSCSLCPLLSDLPFILPSPVSTEMLYKVTESEKLKKNNCFVFA